MMSRLANAAFLVCFFSADLRAQCSARDVLLAEQYLADQQSVLRQGISTRLDFLEAEHAVIEIHFCFDRDLERYCRTARKNLEERLQYRQAAHRHQFQSLDQAQRTMKDLPVVRERCAAVREDQTPR